MNPLAEAAAALATSAREDLHARAADAAAPLRDRVIALAALAIRAARRAPDPRAAGLLDDTPLVDAALAAGLAGAVTGLALALGEALPSATRRYLARVISAAQATGANVATLCLAGGEPALAARAAAPELAALEPAIRRRVLAGWDGAGEEFWAALVAILPDVQRFR